MGQPRIAYTAPSASEIKNLEGYARSFVERHFERIDQVIEQLATEIDLNASTRDLDEKGPFHEIEQFLGRRVDVKRGSRARRKVRRENKGLFDAIFLPGQLLAVNRDRLGPALGPRSGRDAEEGDADRMLSELMRVTRSGGRIGVIVRSLDIPPWTNVVLSPAVRAKVDVPGRGDLAAAGCADASLYQRFRRAGLVELTCFAQWASVDASQVSRLAVPPRRAGPAPPGRRPRHRGRAPTGPAVRPLTAGQPAPPAARTSSSCRSRAELVTKATS